MRKPLLVVAAALALAGLPRAARSQDAAAPPPVKRVRVTENPGQRVPLSLQFTDTRSRRVTLADYFDPGVPVIMILAYSRCAVLCSLVVRGAADVVARLDREPGEDFRIVTVSIDPRETPDEAARTRTAALAHARVADRPELWPFLVGDEPDIRALADSLGFEYAWDPRTEQFAHPAAMFVVTGDGVISRYFYGVSHQPELVDAALAEAAAGRTATPSRDIGDSVLSCFLFDPSARKYGPLIQTMFRVGAAVLTGALLVLIVLLFRWERRRSLP